MRYPLAKHGVFRTVQGEGILSGVPMVFVRLAGCSVGCPQCDTDYRLHERLTAQEIGGRVRDAGPREWVWITGGEPADQELWPLLEEMRLCGRVALATSGTKPLGAGGRLVDFLSVSPHGPPSKLVLTQGMQLNLVPGLGGLVLNDWNYFDASKFAYRYVTPLWYGPGDRAERITECVAFVEDHDGWRLGVQAHKSWGLA
jgi:7-carboxy-7-deazaguanine synthase